MDRHRWRRDQRSVQGVVAAGHSLDLRSGRNLAVGHSQVAAQIPGWGYMVVVDHRPDLGHMSVVGQTPY